MEPNTDYSSANSLRPPLFTQNTGWKNSSKRGVFGGRNRCIIQLDEHNTLHLTLIQQTFWDRISSLIPFITHTKKEPVNISLKLSQQNTGELNNKIDELFKNIIILDQNEIAKLAQNISRITHSFHEAQRESDISKDLTKTLGEAPPLDATQIPDQREKLDPANSEQLSKPNENSDLELEARPPSSETVLHAWNEDYHNGQDFSTPVSQLAEWLTHSKRLFWRQYPKNVTEVLLNFIQTDPNNRALFFKFIDNLHKKKYENLYIGGNAARYLKKKYDELFPSPIQSLGTTEINKVAVGTFSVETQSLSYQGYQSYILQNRETLHANKVQLLQNTVLHRDVKRSENLHYHVVSMEDQDYQTALSTKVQGSQTTITCNKDWYDYQEANSYWVDFANATKFGGGYKSKGNVQEETMFCEFPELAMLDYAARGKIHPCQGENDFCPSDATPFIIKDVRRQWQVAPQLYARNLENNQFNGQISQEGGMITPLANQTPVSIIGLAAMNWSQINSTQRQYTVDHLRYHLKAAYLGNVGAKQNATARVSVHTANWGCGAFQNSDVMMMAIQILAAKMADVDLIFHGTDGSYNPLYSTSNIAIIEPWIQTLIDKGKTPEAILKIFLSKQQQKPAIWAPRDYIQAPKRNESPFVVPSSNAYTPSVSTDQIWRNPDRVPIYRDTEQAMEHGYVLNGNIITLDATVMKAGATFHETVAPLKPPASPRNTTYSVVTDDTFNVLLKLKSEGKNPVGINMAHSTKRGGGVEDGCPAQEECLYRRSNYAMTDSKQEIKNAVLKEGVIYTPSISVFRKDESEGFAFMEKPEQVAIVAVAGLDFREFKDWKDYQSQGYKSDPYNGSDRQKLGFDRKQQISLEQLEQNQGYKNGMKNRIRNMLRAMALHGHTDIVLGTLGCGAFQNPPTLVAALFQEVFSEEEFKGHFDSVQFAVMLKSYDKTNANVEAFQGLCTRMNSINDSAAAR